jgi:GDPmannose 4,6-dehydratase
MKSAIITGITGQDGSFLAELLLEKGYEVWGVYRRASTPNISRVAHIKSENFRLVEGDVSDPFSIANIVQHVKPDEYYNLAAQSHVHTSFEQPSYTFDVNFNGVLNALEAIRKYSPQTKFYQASTSEMFGASKGREILAPDSPKKLVMGYIQDERTPFLPQSPYAIAKLAAHHLVRNYRDSYGIFACCGILFNHESERRGENFVTRKITKWIGEFLASGKDPSFPKLRLGNIYSVRDWGYAKDYVKAMWQMMQCDRSDDYVIATSHSFTVRDFLVGAFDYAGLGDYGDYVEIDKNFYRPSEVDYLCGSYTKANKAFGWKPETNILSLVEIMVDYDVEKARLQRSALQEI